MTMRIIVINDDTDTTRTAVVEQVDAGNPNTVATFIKAGEHKDFTIFDTRNLVVRESYNILPKCKLFC